MPVFWIPRLPACLLHAAFASAAGSSRARTLVTATSTAQKRLEPRQVLVDDLPIGEKYFRLERLDQYDTDLVSRFGFMHMGNAQPLSLSLSCEPADLEILYYDQCKRAVDLRTSVVAFDKERGGEPRAYPEIPDGTVLVSIETVDEAARPLPKEFHVRADYGDVLDMGCYLRRNANRIHLLMNELQTQYPLFLPPGVQKISMLESICVRPEHFGSGLAEKMLEEAIKLAKNSGAEYMSAICLLSDLRTICGKFKFKPYMDFSLTDFRDRGNVVFKPVYGDVSSSKLSLFIAKLTTN